MPLPPPNSGIRWTDYQIEMPSYRLSPLEKPDMSPYLVHMTGKNEILSILNSGVDGAGKINSCTPSEKQADWYQEKVVCFTESPLFAIDAFRYLRFPRWRRDQRFGIGFSKERLVEQGVRPVLYLDNEIMALLCQIKESQVKEGDAETTQLLDAVMPLMFPLGERSNKQGFMWEREWRYPHSKGFSFKHSDIQVICCPENEVDLILNRLGDSAENIKIVQTWSQYDDITSFISSIKNKWDANGCQGNQDSSAEIKMFGSMKKDLNKLIAHEEFLAKLAGDLNKAKKERELLEAKIQDFENDLMLSGHLKSNSAECFECKKKFEKNEAVYELERQDCTLRLCLGCYALYMT